MNTTPGIIAAVLATVLTSCFTGVEYTPKVTEKEVRHAKVTKRPETHYLDDVTAEPFAQWQKGKRFTATDDRVIRLMGASGIGISSLSGETLEYLGAQEVLSITSQPVAELTFSTPQGEVAYRTDISLDSLRRRSTFEIPFLTDEARLQKLAAKLVGNTYYITTPLWCNSEGVRVRGLKFVPVRVRAVTAGSGVYPVWLLLNYEVPQNAPAGDRDFKPGTTVEFKLPMSYDMTTGVARTFADQFSLSDPRLNYPRITDSNWQRIERSRVGSGMTRDECRLALGGPARVERVPGATTIYERWTYENGALLIFADGILSSYRN